jgi:hypothetical protein
MLALNAVRPHRPTMVIQQQGTVPVQPPLSAIHGDLKTVAYFLASAGAANAAVLATMQAGQSTTGGTFGSGLARLEGDRVAIAYAMEQSTSLAASTKIVAPEVVSLAFRYFDGTQWQISWDASTLQALPQAIEITIAVQPLQTVVPVATSSTSTSVIPLRTYRHVVPVYSAAPPAATQ